MADAAPVVHIGENSPEEVAYKLLMIVGQSEGKNLKAYGAGETKATRKWLLDAYAECLAVVRGSKATGTEDSSTIDTFAQLGRQG